MPTPNDTAGFEPSGEQKGLHPDDRKRSEAELFAAVEHGNEFHTEFRILWPSGEVRVIEAHAVMHRSRQLNLRFCEITGRSRQDLETLTVAEITHPKDAERKRIEEQLQQAQKMDAIGTLAGGIAHDFNNVLAAINGYTELCLLQLTENAQVREHLGSVLQASKRAAALVGQILTFSRNERPERRHLQLRPVVEETFKLLRASIPSTIEFVLDLAPDTPAVLADPTQIHQILMNLGTNAWHAMKDRTGRLQVKLETVVIDDAYAPTQAQLRPGIFTRISVGDTGCGMDQATLRRIFEPFFTTKPVGQGTGLGLAVVHGIMANHDGAVTVYSEPGNGTVFHLYFPAHAGELTTVVDDTAPTPLGHGEQVLFIDDEELLTKLGQRTLTALGYAVTVAQDPGVALEWVRASPSRFAVVITDQTMPGMTGLMLASELRGIRAGLPIILMTGYGLALTEERLRAAGIHHLLLKPTTIHTLGIEVHAALSARPLN